MLSIGATYPTRSVGDAIVLDRHSWPFRIGGSAEFFSGLLLSDGRPVRWDLDGKFFGGLGNDPYDLILT